MPPTLRLALLTLALSGSILAHGQAALLVLIFGDKAASENFHFTLDAGLNLSSMPGVNGTTSANGFYFGLGTYIKLNDNWAFTPERNFRSASGMPRRSKVFLMASGTSSHVLPCCSAGWR